MRLLQPHRARNRCTQTRFGTCHFVSSMYLIYYLCSHYRLITSIYKCVPFIDIFREFVSIYLGLHRTTTNVFQGELHSSITTPTRPAVARIHRKMGLGGSRTVSLLSLTTVRHLIVILVFRTKIQNANHGCMSN